MPIAGWTAQRNVADECWPREMLMEETEEHEPGD